MGLVIASIKVLRKLYERKYLKCYTLASLGEGQIRQKTASILFSWKKIPLHFFFFFGKTWFCRILCELYCSITYMFSRCIFSVQLNYQQGTVSYCFITQLNVTYLKWMEKKKEEKIRGRKKVEGRKICPRLLGFSWASISWVKYKRGAPVWLFSSFLK